MRNSQPDRADGADRMDGADASLRALLARVERGAAAAAERALHAPRRQTFDAPGSAALPPVDGAVAPELDALAALLPRLLHARSSRDGVAPARALGERAYAAGLSLPEVLVAAARLQDRVLQEVAAEWRASDRLAAMALLQVGSILHELRHEATLAYVERLTATLTAQALTDSLTGLANRRAFDERLAEECARGARLHQTFALVLLDLDGLKGLNDTGGHAAGDRALTMLAETLRGQARGIDVVARLGGDEFAVVLPEADYAGAEGFVRRVAAVVGREEIDGYALSVSAGVALCPDDGVEPAALLRHADAALYRVKRARTIYVTPARERWDEEDVHRGA